MIDPVKLSKTIVAIKEWQISGQCPKRALVPHEIEKALNLPMVTLAPALELTGFKKCVIWGQENNKRVKRIKWVPKGVGIPKPQRGRPSYAQIVSNIFNN